MPGLKVFSTQGRGELQPLGRPQQATAPGVRRRDRARCSRGAILGLWLLAFALLNTGAPAADSSTEATGSPNIHALSPTVRIHLGREARTTIVWNAGNDLEAEVYVSKNGHADELFARGQRGAGVAAGIEIGDTLIFKLYGNPKHTTLLGTATVHGVAPVQPKTVDGARPVFVKWILLSCAAGIFLLGAIYVGGAGKKAGEKIPGKRRDSRIGRPLLAAGVIFVALDGLIFHTGFYSRILSRQSYAGELHQRVAHEKQRAPTGLREVLVVGDSRVARGFSDEAANADAAARGYKFVNIAVRGSTPRVWFYLLRESDPTVNRYAAIVVPVEYHDTDRRPDSWKDSTDFEARFVAPLLRYRDAFDFAASFSGWSNQCKAFTACVLRGYAFQADVLDLLAHPMLRVAQVNRARRLSARARSPGRVPPENLVGIVYDAKTDQLRVPPGLAPSREASLRQVLFPPATEEKGRWVAYRKRWISKVLERYGDSETVVVLMQMPRGPVVPPAVANAANQGVAALVKNDRTILLDGSLFHYLEKPDYFFDGLHLNQAGRQEFTHRMVEELTRRLPVR